MKKPVRLAIMLAGFAVPAIAAAQTPGATDRSTGGYDAARTSTNNADTAIGIANVATLKPAWAVSVDGSALTAQAIVATALRPRREAPLSCRARCHDIYIYRAAPFGVNPLQSLFNDILVGDVAWDQASQTMITANLDAMKAYSIGKSCLTQRKWVQPGISAPGGAKGQAVSPPTIANGIVYYGNGEAETVRAFDLGTGKRLWAATMGGAVFAQPTVAGGALIVPAWDGKVTAFRP